MSEEFPEMIESVSVTSSTTQNIAYYGETKNVFKLYEAIGKASAEFTPMPKNKAGQYGNNKFDYTPYATLRKCIVPALVANGVTIIQPTHTEKDKVAITLIVSGHEAAITSTITFNRDQVSPNRYTKEPEFDVQKFGSEHTYWRRYQLQSFFCLEGDKDADDLVEPDKTSPPVAAEKVVAASKPTVKRETPERSATPVVAEATKADSSGATGAETNSVKPLSLNEKLMDAKKQLKWEMTDFDKFCQDNIESFPGFISAMKMTSEHKLTLVNLLLERNMISPF